VAGGAGALAITETNRPDVQRFGSVITRAAEILFPLFLFLSAFLPRAAYLVARSTLWHRRAAEFMQAVLQRDWAATLLAPHPGVTTMWFAGIANWLGTALVPGFDEQRLGRQMSIELLPLVLIISLAIVLTYFILRFGCWCLLEELGGAAGGIFFCLAFLQGWRYCPRRRRCFFFPISHFA